ncbi:hypothetical protein [Tautonia sociabilis]|uniref:Uncharacterized protein n=1 Tax=Tautonia sociabilis TaxID=2080755 RepID=A0A432MLT9_9BACT|nr:hypothetical protein [Tautonia sociabilis]RUL88362.1 hypothetical protein TsocGM_07505 [Tautonia sociabilis]
MKSRRYLTVAGLGLALIRPAGADEPPEIRTQGALIRSSARASRVVVEDGPPRDPGVRKAVAQVVTDFPPPKALPRYGVGQAPASGGNPLVVPPPGELPGIPAPSEIPGAPELPPPSDLPGVPEAVVPVPPLESGEIPPPLEQPAPEPILPPELPSPPTGFPEEGLPQLPTAPEPPATAVPDLSPIPEAAEAIPPDAFSSGGPGAGALTDLASTAALAASSGFATPEVFGDSFGASGIRIFQGRPQPPPPLPRPPIPPRPPSPFEPVVSAALVPTIRAIKLSENQSPAPRSRLIYQFNFYNDVNGTVNQRFGAPISDIRIYRHVFGFERAFLDQMASFGMRLPLDTVTGDSPLPNIGRTSTALGNLELFAKYVLYRDLEAGRLLSTGLSVSPNTGPRRFAGADYLQPSNSTTIQPFVGGIFTAGRFFAQGFLSIQVPFDTNDVTLLYNDYAFGYFLYRAQEPGRWLTAITPIFEVHVNTPLNHRGVRIDDPVGIPDFVNLTYGAAFDLGRRARFLAAIVTPVTGPRPFDLEVLASLNVYY